MAENRNPKPEDDIDPIGRILDEAEDALRPPEARYLVKIDKLENCVGCLLYIILCLAAMLGYVIENCNQKGCP